MRVSTAVFSGASSDRYDLQSTRAPELNVTRSAM
jgi:hypothetical protein